MQTWARDELRDLSKGQLECLDALMDLLLELQTMEEVACNCAANLGCSKEAAMQFAVRLFR